MPPFEAKNTCKDGTVVPIEVCAAPIDVQGVTYYFAVIRDITERKDAEAAERGFTRRLLHTLEAERRRVARELHDEVGQAIAAVGVFLHAIENAAPPSGTLHPELAATHATIRQITESVEVQATAPLVNATTTDLGVVMDRTKVEALPLNGRNFRQLVGLQAGVQSTPAGAGGGRGEGRLTPRPWR